MSKTESKETVSLWQNGVKTKFVSKVIIISNTNKIFGPSQLAGDTHPTV